MENNPFNNTQPQSNAGNGLGGVPSMASGGVPPVTDGSVSPMMDGGVTNGGTPSMVSGGGVTMSETPVANQPVAVNPVVANQPAPAKKSAKIWVVAVIVVVVVVVLGVIGVILLTQNDGDGDKESGQGSNAGVASGSQQGASGGSSKVPAKGEIELSSNFDLDRAYTAFMDVALPMEKYNFAPYWFYTDAPSFLESRTREELLWLASQGRALGSCEVERPETAGFQTHAGCYDGDLMVYLAKDHLNVDLSLEDGDAFYINDDKSCGWYYDAENDEFYQDGTACTVDISELMTPGAVMMEYVFRNPYKAESDGEKVYLYEKVVGACRTVDEYGFAGDYLCRVPKNRGEAPELLEEIDFGEVDSSGLTNDLKARGDVDEFKWTFGVNEAGDYWLESLERLR